MHGFIASLASRSTSGRLLPACLACLALLTGVSAETAGAATLRQKTFDTPQAAVEALAATLRSDNHSELIAILGDTRLTPRAQEEDRADVEAFLKAYDAKQTLDLSRPGRAMLTVGEDNWTFPAPLVQQGQTWRFDTQAGIREIFNRRIGGNELLTIETLKAFVAAQREYASTHPKDGGARQFACRFFSAKDKKNGLYWPAPEGAQDSPGGPKLARAAKEECLAQGVKPVAFNGYYFKILTRQGKHAPGGSYDYLAGGEMVLGFACVAYPEKFGDTGIMTFVVNQDGEVRQKNLGKKTEAAAKAMTAYDPDATWTKAE
ncbi:MAG: DUF2950 domain-containing protein [Desulfovibrionaceae bacterium]|nr:DUF2950 domain-containing protein [Desulfovibrionaceae bacterium]MBF0513541.1 DUF2950 domain-containing protein [Desulfovibrionaceae bacterium]